MYECVYELYGSVLPATLEECHEELARLGADCRIDGAGWITAACDGYTPELLASLGCRPHSSASVA